MERIIHYFIRTTRVGAMSTCKGIKYNVHVELVSLKRFTFFLIHAKRNNGYHSPKTELCC